MNILEQTENVYTVAENAPLEHLIVEVRGFRQTQRVNQQLKRSKEK